MVLRGSQTRPDDSLEDVDMAIRRAQDYLRQQRAALKKASDDLRSAEPLLGGAAVLHRGSFFGGGKSPAPGCVPLLQKKRTPRG